MTQAVEAAGAQNPAALDAGAEPGAVPGPSPAPSRRDRLRAATIEEIIATARRLLVTNGPDAVSLRAIAREMGMTAPGLYRYFGSHEELLRHVIAGIFTELSADIHQAIEAAGPAEPTPDQLAAKLTIKMVAACREFRRWALNHKAEFGLLFGVPLPGLDDGRYDIADECALVFAGTFFALFLELWRAAPFGVPAPEQIDPGLREQLSRYRDALGTDIPVGAVLTFLRCWTVLYGAVAMEVFGHLRFALEDAAPMFEMTLGDLATLVGLRYPLPGPELPATSVGRRAAAPDAGPRAIAGGRKLRGGAPGTAGSVFAAGWQATRSERGLTRTHAGQAIYQRAPGRCQESCPGKGHQPGRGRAAQARPGQPRTPAQSGQHPGAQEELGQRAGSGQRGAQGLPEKPE